MTDTAEVASHSSPAYSGRPSWAGSGQGGGSFRGEGAASAGSGATGPASAGSSTKARLEQTSARRVLYALQPVVGAEEAAVSPGAL